MKKTAYGLLIILAIIILFGCKKDTADDGGGAIKDFEENQITTMPTATPTPEITEAAETHEGEMRSYLTGLWVPEEIGKKRPYAIQFNNLKLVSNQWGIGQADILYEALVEGGITRLLGIGENYTADKIGSVRSSRHYFVSIADEYDAIYVHFGRTKYALSKIQKLGINNMDGMTIGTTVFYRDKSIKAPHNAFASLKGIQAGIKKMGYKTDYAEDYQPHYSFYEEDTDLTSESAVSKVNIKFSASYSPYLEYNNKDRLYYRYQFNAPHKDSNTGEQLAFKNVMIQFVKEWDIDKNGYQTMDLENAEGKGYYITNGKMSSITWKKKEADRWMRYYNEAGEELKINPGKTFIALFPNNRTKDVVITK